MTAEKASREKESDHFEAHGVLEENIVVLADGKVMGVEEGLLHGERLPCNLLPCRIILIDLNLHLCTSDWLDLTASKTPKLEQHGFKPDSHL